MSRSRLSCQPPAYLGKETLAWVETGFVLQQFSKKVGDARAKFSDFVRERMSDGRRYDPQEPRPIDELLSLADKEMYRHKQSKVG